MIQSIYEFIFVGSLSYSKHHIVSSWTHWSKFLCKLVSLSCWIFHFPILQQTFSWKYFFFFSVEQTFSKFLYLNKHLIRHCCLFFLFLINEFVYSKYFLYINIKKEFPPFHCEVPVCIQSIMDFLKTRKRRTK